MSNSALARQLIRQARGTDEAPVSNRDRVLAVINGQLVSIPIENLSIQPLDADLTSWAAIARAAGFDAFVATPSSANLATLLTDETGSGGGFVRATAPTIAQPKIAGTTTNDAAAAGDVGEYISGTGTAVSLTTNTAADIATIALTAGDWDVSFNIHFNPANTTSYTLLTADMSLVTATQQFSVFDRYSYSLVPATIAATGTTISRGAGPARFSLAATTSIFLVAKAVFTASTLTASGIISARRVR